MRIACVSFLIVSTLLAACGGAPTQSESEPEIGTTSSASALGPRKCPPGEVYDCTPEGPRGKLICVCDPDGPPLAAWLASAPVAAKSRVESEIDVTSAAPAHLLKGRCPPGEYWNCTNEGPYGKQICGCNYETPDDAR